MPMGHDQPDNALRLKKLGAGDSLSPKNFTAERVAEKLRRLMSDSSVAAACAHVAERCRDNDAASKVVRLLGGAALTAD